MKKLLIVCDEKCRKYGDYLSQLVSSEDDAAEETVGSKDGAVAARVWTEEQYKANSSTFSSEQYVLFIGNSKLIKEKSTCMNIKFSQYGMEYGWLGRQAFLSVKKVVEYSDYESFIEYERHYQTSMEPLIKSNYHIEISSDGNENAVVCKAELFNPIKALKDGAMTIRKIAQNGRIKEKQYYCAVKKFYLDDLSGFLGL